MSKLFFQPPSGRLGATIDALREEGYKVVVAGWGTPPACVETDPGNFEAVKSTALLVDKETQFFPYRADLLDKSDLMRLGKDLDMGEVARMCVILGAKPATLLGYAQEDAVLMLASLVSSANDHEKLVAAMYEVRPDLF
jgi:hypothetical protein